MPRQARIDAPGALHHIICRGIERRKIFLDDDDLDDFVGRLAHVLTTSRTRCLAWSLLPNHFHLLLQTGSTPIATVMRRLLTGYALCFNRRHKRSGHLFQNRYKSILCEQEPYLLELVRYIHLNPLRARLVASLAELNRYPYSGHIRLIGHIKADWQDSEEILARFGVRPLAARKRYLQFISEGVGQGRRPELTGGGLVRSMGGWGEVSSLRRARQEFKSDERILGGSEFVGAVLASVQEDLTQREQLKRNGYDFDYVLNRVAQIFDLEAEDVIRPGKRPVLVQARSLLCYWTVKELGQTTTSVAQRIGVRQPSVSRAAQRGEELAAKSGYKLI